MPPPPLSQNLDKSKLQSKGSFEKSLFIRIDDDAMIIFMKHSNTPLNNSIAMELKYNMLKHLPYQYFNPKERCKN